MVVRSVFSMLKAVSPQGVVDRRVLTCKGCGNTPRCSDDWNLVKSTFPNVFLCSSTLRQQVRNKFDARGEQTYQVLIYFQRGL